MSFIYIKWTGDWYYHYQNIWNDENFEWPDIYEYIGIHQEIICNSTNGSTGGTHIMHSKMWFCQDEPQDISTGPDHKNDSMV